MPFGGSPEDIREHARHVRAWADDVEADATDIRRGRGVEWASTAGDSFVERIDAKAGEADDVAGSMREAAADLDHLADTLESRQDTLYDLLEKAGKTIEDVREMVANGVTDVLGGMQDLADEAMEKLDDLRDKAGDLVDDVKGLL